MSYYNIDKTIEIIRNATPHFELSQLADLCSRKVLTPLFYYSHCLAGLPTDYFIVEEHRTVEPCTFSGYLTADSLISLIHDHAAAAPSTTDLNYATVYEAIEAGYTWDIENKKQFATGELVALFKGQWRYDDYPPKTTQDRTQSDTFTVTPAMILFSSDEVEAYANSLLFGDLTTPEQQRIAELESLLAQAYADNDQLRRQHSKPTDDDKDLPPNSQAAVTRLLNVLFHMGGHDLSAHSGTLRERLISYSKHPDLGGETISEGFLTPWLKRVQDLRLKIDDKNRGI